MYYFAHDFFEIGCKGTIFCAHSQTNCTKRDKTCTFLPFCATISYFFKKEVVLFLFSEIIIIFVD